MSNGVKSPDSMAEWLPSLQQWVSEQLSEPHCQLMPLPGDAGFRRYLRVVSEGEAGALTETSADYPLLAVYAPVAQENSHGFVAIARYLQEQGIATPRVRAVDFQQGFLLLEDFGDQLYYQVLLSDASRADELIRQALTTLLRLQQGPITTIPAANDEGSGLYTLPQYNQAFLRRELMLFQEWFIDGLLGYRLGESEQELLEALFLQLEGAALQQPQLWVHRDFHSRNLVYRDGLAPGVIDFQDAVRGPITYDLVSLLKDCYLRWPPSKVREWALAYGDMAVASGLMSPVTQRGFLRWFDWMGMQRHLKVLGIFARLSLRDGKTGYLQDLPLVIRYVLETAAEYPEFEDFRFWFREKLLPLCEEQDWYKDYQQAGEAVAEDSP